MDPDEHQRHGRLAGNRWAQSRHGFQILPLIKEQSDQSIMQTIQTNQYLGPSSKACVIYFLIGHTWDIYGQMAVYLRLNGIVPPRSQRP